MRIGWMILLSLALGFAGIPANWTSVALAQEGSDRARLEIDTIFEDARVPWPDLDGRVDQLPVSKEWVVIVTCHGGGHGPGEDASRLAAVVRPEWKTTIEAARPLSLHGRSIYMIEREALLDRDALLARAKEQKLPSLMPMVIDEGEEFLPYGTLTAEYWDEAGLARAKGLARDFGLTVLETDWEARKLVCELSDHPSRVRNIFDAATQLSQETSVFNWVQPDVASYSTMP